MFFANRSHFFGALALAAAVAGCSSTDQSVSPTGLRSAPKGPHRTEIGIGNIALCKVAGPSGTYHFHIDVAGGGDFTLGAGADPTIVFTGAPSCINTAYTTVDNATWAVPGTTAAVTITETQIPAGVTVDSIEVTDETGEVTSTVLNNPLVIIVEGPQDLHTVMFFNAALPSVTCTAISAVINVPLPGTQLTATGGSGAPYTFTATGLPPGVSISSSGLITGTPTASGTFNYTVTVTDKKGHSATSSGCTLTVGDTPTATCLVLSLVKNVPLAPVAFTGTGGTGGPYKFSATGLPTGLTLSEAGTLSGTPTVDGTYNYTVTVTDKDGHSGTVNCSVTVNPPPSATCVAIVAVQGTPITPVTMVGSGGTGGPYTFSATGLPAGLTMSTGGTISGTPTVSGTFNYTVTVTDKDGHTGTVNCSVTVQAAPTAACATITAFLNVAITPVTLTATGGTGGPYTFSAAGLPAGLTMSSSGTISGTPTVSGTFSYTVTVTDNSGHSGSINCSVNVTPTKTFGIGPSSMEGHLTISPNTWFNGGYSFKFVSGAHLATQFTVSAKVEIAVTCPHGGGPGGTITIPLGTRTYNVPANNSDWLPTGDQNSILSWMGAVQTPDLCAGHPMDNAIGAVFTAMVNQSPASGSLVDFRFKYRNPAAKGKTDTNCTDPLAPFRNDAATCGASWSQTVRDP